MILSYRKKATTVTCRGKEKLIESSLKTLIEILKQLLGVWDPEWNDGAMWYDAAKYSYSLCFVFFVFAICIESIQLTSENRRIKRTEEHIVHLITWLHHATPEPDRLLHIIISFFHNLASILLYCFQNWLI